MRLGRRVRWRMVMEKRTFVLRQTDHDGYERIEPAVGPHRELAPGSAVAHPPHRFT